MRIVLLAATGFVGSPLTPSPLPTLSGSGMRGPQLALQLAPGVQHVFGDAFRHLERFRIQVRPVGFAWPGLPASRPRSSSDRGEGVS